MAKGSRESLERNVERTPRGVRQDAELAMGSDPLRALVELITNSDDAYMRAKPVRKGKITIEVERGRNRPSILTVRDRAQGMTLSEMDAALGTEGSRSSGFEAQADVRGLLGRGAKDCAVFGPVEWVSTKAGRKSILRIPRPGKCNSDDLGATDKSEHGTVATVEVGKRFHISPQARLKERLQRHYSLRPCLTDRDQREVLLIDVQQSTTDHLVYDAPVGVIVEQTRVQIPGYPGEYADVTLCKSNEFLADQEGKEYWRHGLLISSGRAAYDIYGGRFEREPWAQYLGWFFGEAKIPGISRLIREYDDALEIGDEPPESNPVSLVTRNRRGLVDPTDHPFVAAVQKSLEEFLFKHLDQLKQSMEESRTESPLTGDTQQLLKALGKVLGDFFTEQDEDIGQSKGGDAVEPILGLAVIPEIVAIREGSRARFSVQLNLPGVGSGLLPPTARVKIAAGQGVLDKEEFQLIDRGSHYSKSFSVSGIEVGEFAECEIEVEGLKARCLAECRQQESPPAVVSLQFGHSSYRVNPVEQRKLLLLAPWNDVVDSVEDVVVTVVGDPSVTVVKVQSAWGYDEERMCGTRAVQVRGRRVGASARVSASMGAQSTSTEVRVSGSSANAIRFEIISEWPGQRAVWDEDTLLISAADKSLSRYLGPAAKGWPGQQSVQFRTALAEIIAFHAARKILSGSTRSTRQTTAEDIYKRHMALEQKCLAKIHAVLVPRPDIPGAH